MRIQTALYGLSDTQRYHISKWFTNPRIAEHIAGEVIPRDALESRTWNKDENINVMYLHETANNNRAYIPVGLATQSFEAKGRWYFLAHSSLMSIVISLSVTPGESEYVAFTGSHPGMVYWFQGMGLTDEQFQCTPHEVNGSIPPHLLWLKTEYEEAVAQSETGDFTQLSKMVSEYMHARESNTSYTDTQLQAWANFSRRFPKLASTYDEKQINLRNAQNSIQHTAALVQAMSGLPGVTDE